VQAGDEVYVVSKAKQVDSFFDLLGRERYSARSVMIHGGGSIGRRLAAELSRREVKVKLIDSDPVRCAELASELSNVLVLNGDAADQDLLKEEGIANVDMFVGATDDEEKNILGALLAKRLGAKVSAVIITKSSYINIISEIGIDIVVSPHIAAASSILKFVRSGSISSIFSTRDDRAEVLEIVAEEGSRLVGTPLSALKLPAGVIVAAVHNEQSVTIPRGDTVIEPGSHVIFFASRKALPKLQRIVEERGLLFS
jgi:trk system potassium uptake protein TrkA